LTDIFEDANSFCSSFIDTSPPHPHTTNPEMAAFKIDHQTLQLFLNRSKQGFASEAKFIQAVNTLIDILIN